MVVEGIGSIMEYGLFNPLVDNACTCWWDFQFNCFKQNDTVLYLNNSECNHCFCRLQVLTSITKEEEKLKLSISPNPFSTQIVLQSDIFLNNAILTVDNYLGQTIVFSRDNFSSGLYFVRLIENDKLLAVDKLVITDN